jgi:glyoxylase-like metal-dependent hydrolase (beta-lactamase superfamily II)/ferredoxin
MRRVVSYAMANIKKKLPGNIEGNFFVDSTCINCDACRQLAPEIFQEQQDFSSVYHQPAGDPDNHHAYQAMIACPVGSIGVMQPDRDQWQAAMASFPLHLDDSLYYAGFNSEKSFGGNSYVLQHARGNWLIDSPRYIKHLVDAFERMGGIRYIFLTHEDDVADAARYAKRFGATRVIHRADLAAVPNAEWIVEGGEPIVVFEDIHIIPVPGHTPGSMALLYDSRYLFTGDHVWWDRERNRLDIPKVYVSNQRDLERSTEKLLDVSFEWVLPGHGDRMHGSREQMRREVERLVHRIQRSVNH